MNSARWESGTRYYTVNLYLDLLGDWVLLRTWGSRTSARGNAMIDVLRSESQASSAVERIHRQRVKHRYRLVSNSIATWHRASA